MFLLNCLYETHLQVVTTHREPTIHYKRMQNYILFPELPNIFPFFFGNQKYSLLHSETLSFCQNTYFKAYNFFYNLRHFILQSASLCSSIWLKSQRILTLIRKPLISVWTKTITTLPFIDNCPRHIHADRQKQFHSKNIGDGAFFYFFFFVFFFILVLVLVLREANLLIIRHLIC